MQGKCPEAHLLVQCREIPPEIRAQADDGEQREALAPWVEALWREKDTRLTTQTAAV